MTLKNQMDEFISFANILADESAKVVMEYFRQTLTIENKDDDTPVTIADKKSELKIRELINKSYPSHGILAEEFDDTKLNSEYLWVIDPIDGTRSFVIASPTWSNLISVNYNREPILGLVNFPMLKKHYITGVNKKSYLVENNKFKRLKVLKSKSLNKSKIAGNFFGWLSLDEQKKISKLTKLMRFPCSDALSYCQLCEGKLDVVLQCYNKIWDIHPMITLIKNAGGYITTWKGGDPRVGGSIVASSSKEIHKKVLNLLKPVI